MEVVSHNTPTTDTTFLETSKGIILTTPIIGRITMGHTVIKSGKAIPVKDDHFTLTTLFQDKQTREWEKHPLQAKLEKANEKLMAIPVRIAYNDVNLNLNNRYSAFDGKTGRISCVGNGKTARRVTGDGVKSIDCPRPEACEYAQRMHCKNFSRAYFKVEGQEDELGAFILRTTSFNSLDRLGSRLNQLSGLTKGRIAGMPMMLVLQSKTTTQSFREPIYFADLVTRPEMKLFDAVKEATQYQQEFAEVGLDLEGMEAALRAGLANSEFSDEIEDVDEWLSESDLIAAVENQVQRNTGLRGMDCLASQLSARAAANVAGDSTSKPDRETLPEAEAAPADDAQQSLLQTA